MGSIRKSHRDMQKLKDMIRKKEPEANIIITKIMVAISLVYFVTWILFRLHFFRGNLILSDITLLGSAVLIMTIAIICLIRKGKDKWTKYLLIAIMMLSVFGINVLSGYKTWLFFAVPIIIICRYYSIPLTIVTGIISVMLIIASAFCNAYLSPLIGYMDLNTVSYQGGTTLVVDHWLHGSVTNSALEADTILINSLRLSALPNSLVMFFVSIACIMVIKHGQKLMQEVDDIAEQESQMELEVSNNRAKIMLSQIQPHFLYNTLSAIMSIDGNPEETVDAIGEFGKYLRENLDVLSTGDMVSFSKEMQHVMRYISLEQMRFKGKIQILYELDVNAFSIPALTIQMLVENAIKHGITQKTEGGCIRIQSKEIEGEFIVVVEDNGIGFDPKEIPTKENHVGLANVQSRLQNLCHGYLEIDSKLSEGTVAIVHIPKERSL